MVVAEKVAINPTNNESDVLEFSFPRGVAGFPEALRYGFIYQGLGNMVCMQSIDTPEASFILTPWDTEKLGDTPSLTAEQRACLQASSHEHVMWLLVLNPFADQEWVTANLKAPIAINQDKQIGMQCIRNGAKLELRFPWMRQPQ
ncbi:MAG: flagellar assembly protein FliW [Ghiorsea sp.]